MGIINAKIEELKYNDTFFKIIISDINRIFAYWNISEEYNNFFLEKYGNDFFKQTKEVLFVENKTNNEIEKIEIKVPTNNYYVKIRYGRVDYQLTLKRLGKENDIDYGYDIKSNIIKMPSIKVKLDNYKDGNVKFRNFFNNEEAYETKYFKNEDNYKNRIEKLYNENILKSWGEYKRENGYIEK